MERTIGRVALRALILGGLGWFNVSGCGQVDEAPAASETPAGPLKLGSTGPRVHALHEYLTRYGYFENPVLRKEHSDWQPIISDMPANLDVFDRVTEEGVLEYQKLMGIEQTGVVDDATNALMAKPRCGYPDVDPDRIDPSRKFAISPQKWSTNSLRYFIFMFTSDLPQADAANAIGNAFTRWANVSDLTFTRTSSATNSDIELLWRTPNCGFFPELLCSSIAVSTFPDDGGTTTFNDSYTWDANFLQRIATHEIGHTLGLHHSMQQTAIMYPIDQGRPIVLTIDDMQAIGAVYSSWGAMSAPVGIQDFSVSPDGSGSAWAISTVPGPDFGNLIYSRSSSGVWAKDFDAASLKVAAVSSSVAWVVDKYGQVWERVGPTGNYAPRNPPVAAVDIAYGGGSIWIVGSDNALYVFSGGNWLQVIGAGPGTTTKVAVGPVQGYPCYNNVVWVIKPDGRIARRRTASCTNPTLIWEDMPTLPLLNPPAPRSDAGAARDIAAGADGSVWAVGGTSVTGGRQIYLWNEQDSSNLGTGTPSRRDWRVVSGGAVGVTVQPDGLPWINNSSNSLLRRNRQ